MPDSPDYDALLDAYESELTSEFASQDEISVARSSLEAYVAKIEAERDELQESAMLTGRAFRAADEAAKKYWTELTELRASLPTQDEINFLYGIPIAPGCTPECQTELDRICDRLRKLSGLSEGKTHTRGSNS